MFENLKRYSELNIYDNSEKIGLFIREGSVSSDIRLLVPFNLLSNDKQFTTYFIMKRDYDQVKEDLMSGNFLLDYVIIQRDALDFDFARLLINKCKSWGIKIIYEIDDDLIHFDRSNPGYDYYHSIKFNLEYQITNADIVTVSTDNLKKMLLYLNKNILVIPNRLIDEWFVKDKLDFNRSKNTIFIGYMGTQFHSWDLKYIGDAVGAVKKYFSKKNKTVIFEVIGGTKESLPWANQINVPVYCRKYLDFVPWLKSSVNWDIVVAPLEDNNLNFSKSELKYIEYSALGIPGVFSDVGPYSQKIISGYNGLLTNNSSEEWSQNIIRLIEDEVLRNKILLNSWNDIRKNYLIHSSLRQWKLIFSCFKRDKENNQYKNFKKRKFK